MKRFLKVIAMILIVTLAVTLVPVEAHAKGKTCGYKGCTRSTENCSNGTVFCDIHAAAYAREQGYKVCAAYLKENLKLERGLRNAAKQTIPEKRYGMKNMIKHLNQKM